MFDIIQYPLFILSNQRIKVKPQYDKVYLQTPSAKIETNDKISGIFLLLSRRTLGCIHSPILLLEIIASTMGRERDDRWHNDRERNIETCKYLYPQTTQLFTWNIIGHLQNNC